MCDTFVAIGSATSDGSVLFGKNSDREPGEAQLIEVLPASSGVGKRTVHCTWCAIPEASATHLVALSRPAWMWGAEMGVNEHGLAIGNEAVFTRIPVDATGLTGMDLLRLALERCKTAEEALTYVVWLLERYGQGGVAGYRNKGFRYHNAFLFADRSTAWVLETAGVHWAAQQVRSTRSISNVLSIRDNFDRVSRDAESFARKHGFLRAHEPFDFRKAFSAAWMIPLTGGDSRAACTLLSLQREQPHNDERSAFRALREHNGYEPHAGVRMQMPCAHASYLPTRTSGQTTASMVARLNDRSVRVWATGTSSPCLSVFKPVALDAAVELGPVPSSSSGDHESLFFRHERLHRTVLENYRERRASFEEERSAFEQEALQASSVASVGSIWNEHRERVVQWQARAASIAAKRTAYSLFWKWQSYRDGIND